MTGAEIALVAFGLCNGLRVVAYVPQILTIARDHRGASGVSCLTWGLFALSHLSTVAYALLTLNDWRMAAIFGVNGACCCIIILLAALRRRSFARDQFSTEISGTRSDNDQREWRLSSRASARTQSLPIMTPPAPAATLALDLPASPALFRGTCLPAGLYATCSHEEQSYEGRS